MGMTSNPTKSSTAAATAKGKTTFRKSKDAKSPPPPLKVVIRRLPHEMKEEDFLTALTPVAEEARLGERASSWDLVYFAPGKMSKRRGRVTSTAYLQINRTRGLSADLSIIKLRAAVLTCEAMTGPAPKDTKDGKAGERSADAGPMVLAAPFQKLFKQKPKKDVRVGTIEKDADFKAFCAALQSPPPPPPSADVQVDTRDLEGKDDPKSPNAILDFLKEREAKKSRESQRTATVGSAARGTRRSSSSSGGSSGSTTAKTTATAAAAAGMSATSSTSATKLKHPPPPPSSSSTAISSAETPKIGKSKDEEREPPKAHKSRSGGSGGGGSRRSNSQTSRGSSSAARPPPSPAAQEQTSESGSEGPILSKEKGGAGSVAGSGGGRRNGGKSRAGGKSTSSGSR